MPSHCRLHHTFVRRSNEIGCTSNLVSSTEDYIVSKPFCDRGPEAETIYFRVYVGMNPGSHRRILIVYMRGGPSYVVPLISNLFVPCSLYIA